MKASEFWAGFSATSASRGSGAHEGRPCPLTDKSRGEWCDACHAKYHRHVKGGFCCSPGVEDDNGSTAGTADVRNATHRWPL